MSHRPVMYVEHMENALENALERKHEGDAGIDLRCGIGNGWAWELEPGETCAADTGIKVAIPEGHVGMVCSRSGLAKKGLVVANAPGIIDSGYRGEVKVLLHNQSSDTQWIERGDRIAQLVITPVTKVDIHPVMKLPESSDGRGEGGFGSTGVQ